MLQEVHSFEICCVCNERQQFRDNENSEDLSVRLKILLTIRRSKIPTSIYRCHLLSQGGDRMGHSPEIVDHWKLSGLELDVGVWLMY